MSEKDPPKVIWNQDPWEEEDDLKDYDGPCREEWKYQEKEEEPPEDDEFNIYIC